LKASLDDPVCQAQHQPLQVGPADNLMDFKCCISL